MSRQLFWKSCPAVIGGAILLAVSLTSHGWAQDAKGRPGDDSRLIQFDHPGGDAPNLEVNVTAEMLGDLFGLGNAALEGVAAALIQSGTPSDETQLVAEQTAAVGVVVRELRGAINEVKVRVYAGQDSAGGTAVAAVVSRHYANKLTEAGWDKLVYMSGVRESVNVFMQWDEGALRGVFVVAGSGRELVLVNVACDLSPDRLKRAAETITGLWLELGGRAEVHAALRHLHREVHAASHSQE